MSICLRKLKSDLIGEVQKTNFTPMQKNTAIKKVNESIYKMYMTTSIKPESNENIDKQYSQDDFTNHSGGAFGSDIEWDKIGVKYGFKNHNHYFHGERSDDNAPQGNFEISDDMYKEGGIKAAKAAKRNYGAKFNITKDSRLTRNWSQVKNSDAVFAIGKIVSSGEDIEAGGDAKAIAPSVAGGTGYAVGMAILNNTPVYVFNQVDTKKYKTGWYKYDPNTDDFISTDIPTLTRNYAGIGTRKINDSGKKAIEDVYKKTLESISNSNTSNENINTEEKDKNEINIYSGSGDKYSKLSNFNAGPVKFNGNTFSNIEAAYHYEKLKYSKNKELASRYQEKLLGENITGREALSIGSDRKVNLNTDEWNKISSNIMKNIMLEYYSNNNEAKELLLSTIGSKLTHEAKTINGKWRQEFPRILTEVRSELSNLENISNNKDENIKENIKEKNLFDEEFQNKDSSSIVENTDVSKSENKDNDLSIVDYINSLSKDIKNMLLENPTSTKDEYLKGGYIENVQESMDGVRISSTDEDIAYGEFVSSQGESIPNLSELMFTSDLGITQSELKEYFKLKNKQKRSSSEINTFVNLSEKIESSNFKTRLESLIDQYDYTISGSGPSKWRTKGEQVYYDFGFKDIGGFLDSLIGMTGDGSKRTNNPAYHDTMNKLIDIVKNTMANGKFMKGVEIVFLKTNDEYTNGTYEAFDGQTGMIGDVRVLDQAGRLTIRYGKDFKDDMFDENGKVLDAYENTFSGFREIVMHEVLHSMVDEAVKYDNSLYRQLDNIQKLYSKYITPEAVENAIFDRSGSSLTVAQKNQVKDIVDHINSSPVEFLMYSLTNPAVFEIMDNIGKNIESGSEPEVRVELINTSGRSLRDKREGTPSRFKQLIDKFVDVINKVYSTIKVGKSIKSNGEIGNRTPNEILLDVVKNAVLKTVLLSTYSNKTNLYNDATYDDYKLLNISDRYRKYNEKLIELGEKGFEKLNVFKEKAKPVERIEKIASWMNRFEIIKDSREKGRFRLFTDVINTIVEDTTNKDNGAAAFYKMYRDIKGSRDKDKIAMLQTAREYFDVQWLDVDKTERESITNLLRSDFRSVGDLNYVSELLFDENKLNEEISKLKKEIGIVEYNENAKFLGFYMIHEESKAPELMRNANMIVNRTYGGQNRRPFVKPSDINSTIDKVDKLASLYALKYINESDKKNIAKTIKENESLVQATANAYYKTADGQFEKFKSVGLHKYIAKGSIRNSSLVDMKYEVLSEDQIREGRFAHTKIRINKEATDAINDGKIYWTVVSRDYGTSRTQGGFDDIHIIDKGMGLRSIMFGNDTISNGIAFDEFAIEHSRKTSLSLSKETNDDIDTLVNMKNQIVPSYNIYGSVVDYELPISTNDRIVFGKANNDIAEVMAQTISHINSKDKAIYNNSMFANMLIEESEQNKNKPGYVLLRPTTVEEAKNGIRHKYEEEWAMLPNYIQDMILKKDESGRPTRKGLWVKEGRINNIIGYKDASILDIKMFSDKPMFENRPDVRRAIEMIEYYWKQAAGRYKEIVVKYFPSIIWANMSSNMFVAMRHGVGPFEYAKAFIRHWNHLTDYLEQSESVIRLQIEETTGKDNSAKIKALEAQMKGNPFSKLIEDGQFTTIMEDLDKSGLTKKSHAEDYLDQGFEKLSKLTGNKDNIKEVFSNVFITRNSAAHKAIEKLTVYNDIINKSIIQERMFQDLNSVEFVDKNLRVEKEQDILNYLDQLFVNYSYLDNKYLKYANDTNMLMFTKYFFRALKANVSMATKNPLSTLGFEGFDKFILDVSDSMEQYYSPIDSFANRLMPNPLEMVGDIIMPHSIGMLVR